MKRWLARVRRTSAHEWRLMAEALLLVLRIRVALWVHPFKRVQATYVARGERSGGKGDRCVDVSAAKVVGVAVRRSSCLVPGATCLPQAPATRVMLARRGVPNALPFGVARAENGGLQAHAWIEVGSSSWPATCETWPATNAGPTSPTQEVEEPRRSFMSVGCVAFPRPAGERR